MCVAIFQPPGKHLTSDNIRAAWRRNNDGAGFAFIKDGEVVIKKGYMQLNAFEEALRLEEKENPDSPFIIHLRVRTAGSRNEDNTHPFPIKNGALIHNGYIDGTQHTDTGPSDTAKCVDKFKDDFDYETVTSHTKEIQEAFETNYIVMLWGNGKHHIVNEYKPSASWIDGIWYSNTYWQNSYNSSRPMHGTD